MPLGPAICDVGGGGIVLPLFGDAEQRWNKGLRTVLYLVGLLWLFMGVGVVCDVFMGAIEAITSKKKRVLVKGYSDKKVTVKVWNDTVANLTLLALGSSAPEILLSCIELIGEDLYAGKLGPGTIVGSAAFNLLMIIAVCIASIPDGEVRAIKDTGVFAITAIFSIFAYLWLIVIIVFVTPDFVGIEEGLLTFIFFFILVVTAYLIDIGCFSSSSKRAESLTPKVVAAALSKEELAEYAQNIRQSAANEMTDDEVMQVLERETAEPKSRAFYRVQATREMTGAKRIRSSTSGTSNNPKSPCVGAGTVRKACGTEAEDTERSGSKEPPVLIGFAAEKYAVLENCQEVRLRVLRKGNAQQAISVAYSTRDGTAKKGSDYVEKSGKIHFEVGEEEKLVCIPIVDDVAPEEDEDFYVDLSAIELVDSPGQPPTKSPPAVLGISTATITIIDDDQPGVLSFAEEEFKVTESSQDEVIEITVKRRQGSTGKVTCSYRTEDDSAIAPHDYEEAKGEIVFENGVSAATVSLTIKAKGRYERTEAFRLILEDPTGGATLDASTDGGEESCILTINIIADSKVKNSVDRISHLLGLNWDKAQIGSATYADQFKEALSVNGGDEDSDEKPSALDWVNHILCLPWKLYAAMIPPVQFCGGWLCFGTALVWIGLVTMIIGDMAKLMGCCMGISEMITAITFVALGTSLPDTFASKTAAQQDPYADASIVNVTGSNSVNVFLGLGLPWSIGAFYWSSAGATNEWKARYPELSLTYPDGGFIVKSGDLGFSVTVFTSVAVICIIVLVIRRKVFGAELGGPRTPKYASTALLVSLWFTYIALVSWNSTVNAES